MIWAIVPVKPLRRGKSRLAGTLSEEKRTQLNRQLLERTLATLAKIPEITHSLVISRDPAALSIAREYGARTVQEDGAPHLNTALTRATIVAQAHAAHGVLIIPADLPLIDTKTIQMIIRMGKTPPVVVVAPDRRQDGTNALFVSPPGLIKYNFGPGSFKKHCELARKNNANLEILTLPALELDLDLPEDLALLDGINSTRTK